MSYLTDKFKGRFRVTADYDLETEDFIRNEKGDLDPSFDDIFMYGRSGIRIGHGVGSELSFYCPKLTVTNNLVRKFMIKKYGEEVDREKLIKDGWMNEWTDCDEGYFTFDYRVFDEWVEYFGLKISAANRSPFSVKNLPKIEYEIPEEDEKEYKKAVEGMDMLEIGKLGREFMEGKEREKKLSLKQDIHRRGEWEDYINFIKERKR